MPERIESLGNSPYLSRCSQCFIVACKLKRDEGCVHMTTRRLTSASWRGSWGGSAGQLDGFGESSMFRVAEGRPGSHVESKMPRLQGTRKTGDEERKWSAAELYMQQALSHSRPSSRCGSDQPAFVQMKRPSTGSRATRPDDACGRSIRPTASSWCPQLGEPSTRPSTACLLPALQAPPHKREMSSASSS